MLFPLRDPLARDGRLARDPDYRLGQALKALLRQYGFRAVVVRPANPGEIRCAGDWL